MENVIAFPGLGLEFTINKIAFSVFGFDIHWYGIIIAVGFLLAVVYALKKCNQVGIKQDDLIDLLIFAVPISIIGARTYYVVFNYDKIYYYDHPAMFRIWDGGLAIYGAIIAAVITCIFVCKYKGIKLGAMLDIGAMGLLIGQAIGRWGNFVNQEAYGGLSDALWRMEIYDYSTMSRICVQPTFLYESLWNAIGFLLLHLYFKKRKFYGEVFLMYTAWYGFGRGIIEGMRSDSLYFFGTGLRVSQFLGFMLAIISIAILIYNYLFRDRDEDTMATPYLPKKMKKVKVAEAAEEVIEAEEAGEASDDTESVESDNESEESTEEDKTE